MFKRIKQIRTIFKKTEDIEYFWAGYGENPLKDQGIKDFSKDL